MYTKKDIDVCVATRNIHKLTYMIGFDLPEEVLDHLIGTIAALLEGKISFPSRRPKRPHSGKQWEAMIRVMEIMHEPGWGKLEAAVKRAAKELGVSERTVRAGWARRDEVPF
jgi:hypothetical protein